MADITPLAITSVLTARAFVAAGASGDKILPAAGSEFLILEFRNVNVASRTVTIGAVVTSKDVIGHGLVTIGDLVLALAQNDEAVVKIPLAAFQDPADANKVAITYDDEVDVTLRALSI